MLQIRNEDFVSTAYEGKRYSLFVRRPGAYHIDIPPDRHFLDIQVGPSDALYEITGKDDDDGRAPPSSFVFLPSGSATEIKTSRTAWSVQVAFDPDAIGCVDRETSALRALVHVRDDFMASLAQQLAWQDCSEALSDAQIDAICKVLLTRTEQHLMQTVPQLPCRTAPAKRIQAVLDHIDEDVSAPHGLMDLAEVAGLSPYHFSRVFRAAMGQSPCQYVLERRIVEAKRRLDQSEESIAAIAYDCGFGSQSHMTSVFTKLVGITPGKLRRQASREPAS